MLLPALLLGTTLVGWLFFLLLCGLCVLLGALISFLIVYFVNKHRKKQDKKIIRKLYLIPVAALVIGISLMLPFLIGWIGGSTAG